VTPDLPALASEAGLSPSAFNHAVMAVVLVGARVLAFLSASPFFSRRALSRTVRVGLMLALSMLLVPQVFTALEADPSLADTFVALVFKEIVIGLVLGVMMWLPVRGLEFAGIFLDTQRGSTNAQDFDVVFNDQSTPTAIFLSQLFSGFFFASGGFLLAQMVLFDSVNLWPVTEPLPPFKDDAAFVLMRFAGVLFFTAIVFALPIAGFMFMADIAIAFVARAAPTLNALVFGMPVKSAILLIMLFLYVDLAFPKLMETFQDTLSIMEALFRT
jgi:type III secretion protein SpaR/YscT/HrcT